MNEHRRSSIWGVGWLLICLSASPGWATSSPKRTSHIEVEPPVLLAQASSPVLSQAARAVPAIMDSTRAKLLTTLARGDVSAAIVAYEVDTGHPAPAWLLNLQTAYSTASQVVGKCQDVARTIHAAYDRLGQKPEYVAFHALNKRPFIAFDLPGGKSPSITHTGYHVAVKVGDTVRDAYTGSLGLKSSDYLARLHALDGIEWKIVSSP